MSKELFDKVVKDTESYVNNLNKLYKNNLYVEADNKNKVTYKTEQPKEEMIVEDKPMNKSNGKDVKQKETIVVKDMFGNIVETKEDWEFSESLEELNERIHDCKKCRLWETRTNFVFGVGNPNADIVLVGEAPGADEDAKGEPFVGRAGQLLNKIIESINLKREEVYICNILKSRPPGNRNPLPDEITVCEPYLKKQLDLIKPKLILALGKFAAETLLGLNSPLGKMRGKIHKYNGIQTMVTFHPAALLRNPNWKKDTWEDVKQFRKLYDEMLNK